MKNTEQEEFLICENSVLKTKYKIKHNDSHMSNSQMGTQRVGTRMTVNPDLIRQLPLDRTRNIPPVDVRTGHELFTILVYTRTYVWRDFWKTFVKIQRSVTVNTGHPVSVGKTLGDQISLSLKKNSDIP